MSYLRNIVFIGLRGSGKTTVARSLAKLIERETFDTDEWIQRRAKAGVAEIFARLGEAGFRALEHEAVVNALQHNGRVISVGGGAVMEPDNRLLLKSSATCVWLTAPVEVLCERVRNDPRTLATRPALTALDPLSELRALAAARGPFYQELAEFIVNTEGRTVAQVVQLVRAALGPERGATTP